MKKALMFFVGILFALCTMAETTGNAISMMSYEQAWSDSEATIALKNNTNEAVLGVAFRITYLDMSGNPMSYEDFSEKVRIDPGLTKQVKVRAYERSRTFHYYKSEGLNGNAFKVKFELKGYKTPSGEKAMIARAPTASVADGPAASVSKDFWSSFELKDGPDASEGTQMMWGLLVLMGIVGAYVGLYALVAIMARNRYRSAAVWVLFGIIFTPLLMIILLLFIGKSRTVVDSDSKRSKAQHFSDTENRWEL